MKNIVIIMSDEHSNSVMGCTGHPYVRTPNLDRLAKDGALFTNCYTPSPICAPTRASLFTGQYVNRLGTWDNGTPYDGTVPGFFTHLNNYGYQTTSIGRLDFHDEGTYEGLNLERPGFRTSPDIGALMRRENAQRPAADQRFKSIGPRDYNTEDDAIIEQATDWIRRKGEETASKPWVLYIGLGKPHFPFYYKQELWDYYNRLVTDVPDTAKPPFNELNEPLKALRHHFCGEAADNETVRKLHVGYYAMTTELDDNIGLVVDAISQAGLDEDTYIIYTSDHGEQLGYHGLWWKCCMYEESCHIPFIIRGPGIKANKKINDFVSLVDVFPTLCDNFNIPCPDNLQGQSILPLLDSSDHAKGHTASGITHHRDFAFSEYHAHGVPTGMYMIRWKNWKYVYFNNVDEQLFDLSNDINELNNLAVYKDTDPDINYIIEQCTKRLYSICEPAEVSERALNFQHMMKENYGITEYSSEVMVDIKAFRPVATIMK